jgi:putative spermidine/putrescine transport system permease protein
MASDPLAQARKLQAGEGRISPFVARRIRLDVWLLLSLPGVAFLTAFFIVPLVDMLLRSFIDPSPRNYAVFAESSLYSHVLWTTLWISLLVAAICLVVGYPYAYAMHVSASATRATLLALLFLSMWSSVLVRTYAWTVLLQDTGVINSVLRSLGLVSHPLALMRTTTGTAIGMTHVLLPFMVFPIYAAMRRIDAGLLAAASGLGAPPLQVFRRVFLPLSLPGALAGLLLVFALATGFFVTPALLGSPQNEMFGQLIVNQISRFLRFGVASALSVILVVVTSATLALASRLAVVRATFGMDQL